MLANRLMERFAALHARNNITEDVAKTALPLRIGLLIKRGQSLHKRNAGLDHGGQLSSTQNQVSFLDRPGFLT